MTTTDVLICIVTDSQEQKMINLKPIGIIRTPFTKPEGMPIQPKGAGGIRGTIELYGEYHAGL